MTDEQLQEMWRACSEVSSEPDASHACRRLAQRLTEILRAPAVVFRRDVSRWKLLGETSPAPDRTAPSGAELDRALTPPDGCHALVKSADGSTWTAMSLDEDLRSQSVLLLPGDWTTGGSTDWLPRFASTASIAIRLAAARQVSRSNELLAATAHAFARKLTQLSGDRTLYQCIVDTAAQTKVLWPWQPPTAILPNPLGTYGLCRVPGLSVASLPRRSRSSCATPRRCQA
jgi:hypothetical protein